MAKVSLRPITPENLDECISLKVADHQKGFVAPNIYSLAEASVSPNYHPFGIYDADAHYRASPTSKGARQSNRCRHGRIHNVRS